MTTVFHDQVIAILPKLRVQALALTRNRARRQLESWLLGETKESGRATQRLTRDALLERAKLLAESAGA